MERCQGVASIALTLGCSLLPGGCLLADIVTTALELMLIRRTDWGTTVSVTMLMKNIQIFLNRFTLKISVDERLSLRVIFVTLFLRLVQLLDSPPQLALLSRPTMSLSQCL